MNDKTFPDMNTIDQLLRHSGLPRLEARMLLEAATGYNHAALLMRSDECLSENQAEQWQQMLVRRLAGEPMAYILGNREFYGRPFATTPATLIPRPETEHLVEAVLARLPTNGKVWDLGSGSGAIAVTLACERPDAAVFASDISPDALEVAAANAVELGAKVQFACGSWYQAFSKEQTGLLDIIVSNPPYIEADDPHLIEGDLRFEPQNALTDFADGLSAIRMLAKGAGERLQTGGWLLMEHGWNQGAAVRQILLDNGFSEVATEQDLAGLDRLTLGRWLG